MIFFVLLCFAWFFVFFFLFIYLWTKDFCIFIDSIINSNKELSTQSNPPTPFSLSLFIFLRLYWKTAWKLKYYVLQLRGLHSLLVVYCFVLSSFLYSSLFGEIRDVVTKYTISEPCPNCIWDCLHFFFFCTNASRKSIDAIHHAPCLKEVTLTMAFIRSYYNGCQGNVWIVILLICTANPRKMAVTDIVSVDKRKPVVLLWILVHQALVVFYKFRLFLALNFEL